MNSISKWELYFMKTRTELDYHWTEKNNNFMELLSLGILEEQTFWVFAESLFVSYIEYTF